MTSEKSRVSNTNNLERRLRVGDRAGQGKTSAENPVPDTVRFWDGITDEDGAPSSVHLLSSSTIRWEWKRATLAQITSGFAGLVNPRIREGRSGAKVMVGSRYDTFSHRAFRIRRKARVGFEPCEQGLKARVRAQRIEVRFHAESRRREAPAARAVFHGKSARG